MYVLIHSMFYAIIFFGIAISIWKEGSWDKKAFLYDPTARFLMPICFVMGTFCLCGMYIGYVINREIDFGIKESHPNNACFEATNDLYGSRQLVDFELKRVGILGVTHEFVNDREA